MNLDEEQRKKVAGWIAQGLKLSDIQTRIASELGLRLTYMDVRLLVDDLKLVPKDPDPPKQAAASPLTTPATPALHAGSPKSAPGAAGKSAAPSGAPGPGKVSVSVDQLARPGTMASGKVTFSDDNAAEWYFDTTGRLGLVPQKTGYRPSAADVQEFQILLESELSKMGM